MSDNPVGAPPPVGPPPVVPDNEGHGGDELSGVAKQPSMDPQHIVTPAKRKKPDSETPDSESKRRRHGLPQRAKVLVDEYRGQRLSATKIYNLLVTKHGFTEEDFTAKQVGNRLYYLASMEKQHSQGHLGDDSMEQDAAMVLGQGRKDDEDPVSPHPPVPGGAPPPPRPVSKSNGGMRAQRPVKRAPPPPTSSPLPGLDNQFLPTPPLPAVTSVKNLEYGEVYTEVLPSCFVIAIPLRQHVTVQVGIPEGNRVRLQYSASPPPPAAISHAVRTLSMSASISDFHWQPAAWEVTLEAPRALASEQHAVHNTYWDPDDPSKTRWHFFSIPFRQAPIDSFIGHVAVNQ